MTNPIPRDTNFDSTLALKREGYQFISNRCQRLNADIFETRLLLQRTICLRGEDAAKVFYDQNHFYRNGAAPARMQKTLVGQGGVQGLDDAAHRHRKGMFMALMTPERIQQLADLTAQEWNAARVRWEKRTRIVLFDEAQETLCRAVCRWSGVPLRETEVSQRTAELAAMIDGAGAVGLRYWRARWARKSAEQWIGTLIEQLRTGQLTAGDGTPLHVIGFHRDLADQPLESRIAAVELLNVLRPTVAIATFITFAALALHRYPECRQSVMAGGSGELERFVQEVRRFYPFFPFVVARVREDFEWRGYPFPKGRRVLLDLYGTDHDPRIWERPEEFRPERFRDWNGGAFNFIPHGGGDYHEHHRCAGEWLTIELMKVAVTFLVKGVSYRVPEQDLQVSLRRIPTLPKSRFVMEHVTPQVASDREAQT